MVANGIHKHRRRLTDDIRGIIVGHGIVGITLGSEIGHATNDNELALDVLKADIVDILLARLDDECVTRFHALAGEPHGNVLDAFVCRVTQFPETVRLHVVLHDIRLSLVDSYQYTQHCGYVNLKRKKNKDIFELTKTVGRVY